ncbi:MAG: hypothetical protein QM731_04170 [Chitinophagaceae bacterium]
MAIQSGIIRLEGKLDNIVFYTANGRYLARRKTSLNKERIATDPAYQTARNNNTEFARASRAGKELRSSLLPLIHRRMDGTLVNRLNAALLKVLKSDIDAIPGQRNIRNGNMELLQEFRFNKKVRLHSILLVKPQLSVARATGCFTVALHDFVADKMLAKLHGMTHCELVTAVVAMDFDQPACIAEFARSSMISLTSTEPEDIVLISKLPPGNNLPLVLIMGINTYHPRDGVLCLSENALFTPLEIIDVDIR